MRYCTSCGAKLSERARFCTSCGARVGAASADASAGTDSAPAGTGGASGPTGPERVESGSAKPGRSAAPGRVTAPGSAAGSGRAMASERAESERVAASGRATAQPAQPAPAAQLLEGGPEAPADGARPAGLGARMVQFRRTALAAVPTWALALLALLLAAGTAFAVYKAVTVWALPALKQAQSGEEEEEAEEATEDAEEAEEEAAAEEEATQTDDEQLMYQLYYKKCLEYIERYGEPDVVEEEVRGYTAYGLAGIQLVDFNGDGTDELLLAYCTVSDAVAAEGVQGTDSADGGCREAYQVEVWAYEDGAIERVYEERASTADGNDYNYSFALYEYDGQICIYRSDIVDDEYEDSLWYWLDYCWKAMGEDGDFETVFSSRSHTNDDPPVEEDGHGGFFTNYTVDGENATSEKFTAAEEEAELIRWYYLYNYSSVETDGTYLTAQDLVASSLQTLEQLKSSQG